ncbi:hypothetical protein CKJ75_03590 [Mycobacterium avium]|nr:hypothetical protein CKJ75_03590 [Mycobacterium avium]
MLIEVSNPMTLSPNRSIDSASTPSDRLDAAQKVGSVPGSGVSDGGVSVPDVRGPSRESLW